MTAIAAASPPERIRRNIDFVVIAIAFQASLILAGRIPDTSCIQAAAKLMKLVSPYLNSDVHSLSGQWLIWCGIHPLIHVQIPQPKTWPILINPDTHSGIRKDILPPAPNTNTLAPSNSLSGNEDLRRAIWGIRAVSFD